jgi:superfamily II DNA helicase RecQ
MKVKVIGVPFNARNLQFDDRELQEFLALRSVTAASDHFFEINGLPCLALVLHYEDATAGESARAQATKRSATNATPAAASPPNNGATATNGNGAVVSFAAEGARAANGKKGNGQKNGTRDATPYQPTGLNAAQQELYEQMRSVRFKRAKESGIAAYLICTNRELEKIVKQRPRRVEDLVQQIGMQATRVEAFGAFLLESLAQLEKAAGD